MDEINELLNKLHTQVNIDLDRIRKLAEEAKDMAEIAKFMAFTTFLCIALIGIVVILK